MRHPSPRSTPSVTQLVSQHLGQIGQSENVLSPEPADVRLRQTQAVNQAVQRRPLMMPRRERRPDMLLVLRPGHNHSSCCPRFRAPDVSGLDRRAVDRAEPAPRHRVPVAGRPAVAQPIADGQPCQHATRRH